MRWERVADKFQEWDSAAWVDQLISVAGGGTGADTAAGARTNLGIGTMGTQNSNGVNITGGTIAGVNLNASDLTSGTVPLARLSGITNTEIAALAAIAWTKISKVGSSLAELATRSASDLSSGTLPGARLAGGVYSGTITFSGTFVPAVVQAMSWNARLANTVYQAGSDGILVATLDSDTTGDGVGFAYIQSDAANPPTTIRARVDNNPGDYNTLVCPVRKGDFYRLVTNTIAGTVTYGLNWVPFGTTP